MADWGKILSTGNVEDRRGSPMGLIGGGAGLLGVGIALLVSFLSGQPIDVSTVLGELQQSAGQSSLTSEEFQGQDDYEKFTSTVLGSNNDVWRQIFEKSGRQYEEPRLVLFRNATQSGCGIATSDVGPHYCPADATIYIDETFYDVLKTQFGAEGGDVAEAYVLSHEVGHHIQHQLEIINTSSTPGSSDSINIELQADCFAGVWAHSVADLGIFQPGEINEAIDAAAAVGDDRIQAKVQGQVTPETWTHGSSEQRVSWFNKGYTTGAPAQCNTFESL
jgi:predicted metalloprotease